MKKIDKLESITEIHRMLGIPGPAHPLISLLDSTRDMVHLDRLPVSYISGFYKISFAKEKSGQFKYGQGYYDFDEGSLVFTAPNQLIGNSQMYKDHKGYSLIIHPDFLQGHALAKKMKSYGFFSYAISESLHLSEQEKATMLSIYNIISQELDSRIDEFSQEVVIAQIELLLSYAKRFYKRQFLTRQIVSNSLLQQIEELLHTYFEEDKLTTQGMPSVHFLAEQLNFSPNYLSDMLRTLTGLSAQQHIHLRLIEKSKELLSTTSLTVSEVAYQLGFEHPQSFSRLFKTKTSLTPVEFRQAFN